MSYTNGLDKSSEYFDTKLYTGTGATQSITGLNFAPDWVWLKQRNGTYGHDLYDIIRGATKTINTNNTNTEYTSADRLTSFNSDGFTLGSGVAVNGSGDTYASWNWKANGAGVSNTAGTITSTVSANTTSGFSILTRTGTGSNGTVGHGLGVAPKMIINKDINSGSSWWGVFHASLGNTNAIYLNTTNATDANIAYWNNTSPTSSVFSVGTNSISNASGGTYISYCFAEKKGYSKFGSYTGNGNANGTFVYTGMRPAFVMVKRTDVANDWLMFDNKRNSFNFLGKYLIANSSGVEAAGSVDYLDFVSNGFKIRRNGNDVNASGGTYIYMCFSEFPFVTSTSIPTTAR